MFKRRIKVKHIGAIFSCILICSSAQSTAQDRYHIHADGSSIKEITTPFHIPQQNNQEIQWTGGEFDFNDRSNQGWSVLGPMTEDGYPLGLPALGYSWVDHVNYPNPDIDDPIGDLHGSLQICSMWTFGVDDADYTWWVMDFNSPELLESSTWQAAEGYSVKIRNNFSDVGDYGDTLKLYVDLQVTLYDTDQERDRHFSMFMHAREIENWLMSPEWINLSCDWSGGFPDVTNYNIKKVVVAIFGPPDAYMTGGLNLDEVRPIGSMTTPLMTFMWPFRLYDILNPPESKERKFKIGNYGLFDLIYQVKSAPPESNGSMLSASESRVPFSSSNEGDKDVLITGWGDLSIGAAFSDMMTHIAGSGYTVDTTATFPDSLTDYEILILVGSKSANEDIPESVVDEFVNQGNGLIIFEKSVNGSDFDSTAASNPVRLSNGNVYRSGTTVTEPEHPLCFGLPATIPFAAYNTEPVMKNAADVVIEWDSGDVFAAAYHLGYGKVVYFNNLQAWYGPTYWTGDNTNGKILLENALDYVRPAVYHGMAWLSFDPTTGQISPGNDEEVTVTVSGNALPGTYSADIVVITNDLEKSITRFPFTLRVTESTVPALFVDPLALDLNTDSSVGTFAISNAGGGDLNWSIETPHKPWIIGIDPMSGSNDATVAVIVDRAYLTAANDMETLTITSTGGNQDISVQIGKTGNELPATWDYTAYTDHSAAVVFSNQTQATLNGASLTADHYIGAFTPSGICCGWTQWEDSTTSIILWGDDPQTPQTEGFQAGETIAYHIFSMSQQTFWTNVTPTYSEGSGAYTDGSYMILSQLDASGTHVDNQTDASSMRFQLDQNYPNPFNRNTLIRFSLPKSNEVHLAIYTISGRHISTLIHKDMVSGRHSVTWNGCNENGIEVPSGIYVYRLEAGMEVSSKKLLYVK